MSRRFRCGRVVLTLDGKVTKLGLLQGGGVRSCEWNDNDMNFDEVRHRLMNIYNLGNSIKINLLIISSNISIFIAF